MWRGASRLTSSCSGPSDGIAATPRVLHFIMRSRRAPHGSARPLNCGVRRHCHGNRETGGRKNRGAS